jgi:hypothetical protein
MTNITRKEITDVLKDHESMCLDNDTECDIVTLAILKLVKDKAKLEPPIIVPLSTLELSRISPMGITVSQVSHFGLEDSYHPTDAMKAFLSQGRKGVEAVLGCEGLESVDDFDYHLLTLKMSGIVRDITQLRSGVLISATTPTRDYDIKNGGFKAVHGQRQAFWIYGETFEEALQKAIVHIEEFHAASLVVDRFRLGDAKLLLAKVMNRASKIFDRP